MAVVRCLGAAGAGNSTQVVEGNDDERNGNRPQHRVLPGSQSQSMIPREESGRASEWSTSATARGQTRRQLRLREDVPSLCWKRFFSFCLRAGGSTLRRVGI